MFKIEELSGSLIRSGRFKEAIPIFFMELKAAMSHAVITDIEMFSLSQAFASILLNPSNHELVEDLSSKMIKLALRIPNMVPTVSVDYETNVKASREAD